MAKAICLFLFMWRRPEFDERFDGIVYATRAGLGFAGVFIARAVLAVPSHAIYAGLMGYFAARRRFDGRGPGLFGGLAHRAIAADDAAHARPAVVQACP